MTEQEAIEFIELIHTCDAEKLDEALSMAISALEKQIPKKVLPDNYEGHMGKKCPACGVQVWIHQEHCENCGQAIDWTEDES